MIIERIIRRRDNRLEYYNDTMQQWYDFSTNTQIQPNNNVIKKDNRYQIILDEPVQNFTIDLYVTAPDISEFTNTYNTVINDLS